jgi:hypothetical protein
LHYPRYNINKNVAVFYLIEPVNKLQPALGETGRSNKWQAGDISNIMGTPATHRAQSHCWTGSFCRGRSLWKKWRESCAEGEVWNSNRKQVKSPAGKIWIHRHTFSADVMIDVMFGGTQRRLIKSLLWHQATSIAWRPVLERRSITCSSVFSCMRCYLVGRILRL